MNKLIISTLLAVCFTGTASAATLYSADGGVISAFAMDDSKSSFASIGNETIESLAIDTKGIIFAGSSSGLIYKFNPDGSKTSFGGNFGSAETINALAFDTQGFLYAGTGGSGSSIYKIDTNGSKNTFAYNSPTPETFESLAFDRTGNLFGGTSQGCIYKYSPDATKYTFAYSSYTSWTSLAFGINSELYAGTGLYGGRIYKFDALGNSTLFSNLGSQSVNALALAVPEPSTYTLFGLGILAWIVAFRRKVAS